MGNPPIINPIVAPGLPIAGPGVNPAPGGAPGAPPPAGGGPGAPPPPAGGGTATPINLTLNTSVTNQSSSVQVTVQPAPAIGTVLTFSLQVIDDIGGVSPAATCTVTVRALPAASLNGPAAVSAGSPVTLTGGGQASGGGKITNYIWALTKVVAPG